MDRKRDFCIPFSFSPNMVRKTVKLIGPLASLIIASNSSFFTFSWPIEREEDGQRRFMDAFTKDTTDTNHKRTQWGQHVPKVVFADDTVPVLVNDCESLCVQDRKKTRTLLQEWVVTENEAADSCKPMTNKSYQEIFPLRAFFLAWQY